MNRDIARVLVLGAVVGSLTIVSCAKPPEPDKPKTAVQRLKEREAEYEEKNAQATLDHLDRVDGAKKVIGAVIKASEKHGDHYPGPKEFKAWASPYLDAKDRPLLDTFEWTFKGGDVMLIDDLHNTPVGHLGEAVAYVDGSVRSQ